MNTEPAAIDFWFDFASPYGYFMSERIDALAARHGRQVRWHPLLLFAVLRAHGLPPPLEHPLKRDYGLLDFERSARFLGIPYRLPVGFPHISPHAARAFYLLRQTDPAAARDFAQAVMRGYFRAGAAIDDAGCIAALAHEAAPLACGSPADFAARIGGAEARALLASAIEEAVQARIFGSPTVVIDGEAFFGVDRLPQIEARLAGRLAAAPGAAAEPTPEAGGGR